MISRLYDLLKTVWALYSDEQAKQVYNKKASCKISRVIEYGNMTRNHQNITCNVMKSRTKNTPSARI